MEYVQERVATLHDFVDPVPPAPTEDTAVLIPMTGRESTSLAAERVLTALETVDPAKVIVALRTGPGEVTDAVDWLETFDLPTYVLWCDGPSLADLLAEAGLDGTHGKGRDVWLGLGLASDAEYVVVHDADAQSYSRAIVPRLLFPLAHGFSFSKGYYARVEERRLYGRLFRLLYAPLVRTLRDAHDAPILEYLGAFRYALAGEFGLTSDLARSVRFQRGWGLEVGTLGEAFSTVGVDGSAQVDLGIHEHDHRAVGGPRGLSAMAGQVGTAVLRVVEDMDVEPDYATLPDRFEKNAEALIDRYALDAAFNGLAYDREGEREQITEYLQAISAPGEDDRLPAWRDAPVGIAEVQQAAHADLAEVRT